ncbi:MAG TPA: RDD family protein [Jatrophihabitantaceae bacterium]|nr:RDD family protein [Jatrophihabitantaceae bacterium]
MTAPGATPPPAGRKTPLLGAYRGERLGLPETGSGSLGTTGARLAAFLVDAIASSLIAALFVQATHSGDGVADHLPGSWSLLPLAIDYVIGMLVAGRTVGMYLFGLRIVRVDRPAAVNPGQALIRTVLLFLLVPAVIWDRDGRGLHDRASGTAVVRA